MGNIELREFVGEFCDGRITIPIKIGGKSEEIFTEHLSEWILEGAVVPIYLKQAIEIFPNYHDGPDIVGIHWNGECPVCLERHNYWLPEVIKTKDAGSLF